MLDALCFSDPTIKPMRILNPTPISLCALLFLLVPVFKTRAGEMPGPEISESRRQELVGEAAAQASSADQLWTYVQKWHSVPAKQPAGVPPVSPHDQSPRAKAWQETMNISAERVIRIEAACREFIHDFPADPRGWEARGMILEGHHWSIYNNADLALCDQIIAAPGAPGDLCARARQLVVIRATADGGGDSAHKEKIFSDYERDYPDDDYGPELVRVRLRDYAIGKKDPVPVLSQLVSSPNKSTAAAAAKELTLRTKPLDLQFTATDGHPVNLAKLRGKVVLLYFWATWGDP